MNIMEKAQRAIRTREKPEKRIPFEKRFAQLKRGGEQYTTQWKDLRDFTAPHRGAFTGDQPDRVTGFNYQKQLSGHPGRCARTLASGMVSGLTSPSRPWFRLELESRDLSNIPSVRMWLDEVQKRMLAVFAKSNVYGALHTVYEEVAVFGTAASFLVPDFKQVIRCRVFTIGEYYLGQNSAGVVNAFAREFWMTAGQMVEDFGIEQVSEQVKAAYNRHDVDAWFKVCHLIEENDSRIEGIKDFDNMAFREVYWEAGTKNEGKFLKTGGHEEFPILAPRWSTTTTAHVYGTGPGWISLGDVRQFFHGLKMRALGIETVMKPPTQVDGNVGNPNTLPGGVTRSSSMVPNAGARALYQIAPDFNALREDINGLKQDISETFYADLFLMLNQIDRGNLTATEINERNSEKMQILGPVLEQLENELLSPLISRTYQIMMRAGLFSDLKIPEEVSGAPIQIQYVSVLAIAQKMIGVSSIQQAVTFLGNMAAVKPDILDVLNTDETAREYMEALAIPAKMVNTPEAIQQIREGRAEQQAQQAQAQQAMALAKAGADGAKATKDLAAAPIGGDSALDSLLGMNQ